jgi:hypothetical protein
MRPLLAAAPLAESLVMELAAALTAACTAPAEELEVEAVPQYSAALEAASSLGQALRTNYLGVSPEAALDAVLGITAALAAAASGEEEDKAAIRAEGTDKRFSDPKNTEEKKKNGAAIPPVCPAPGSQPRTCPCAARVCATESARHCCRREPPLGDPPVVTRAWRN